MEDKTVLIIMWNGRSNNATQSSINNSGRADANLGNGRINREAPIYVQMREIMAEEVTKAIQATMPPILEQIKENTRKMIEDAVLTKQDKRQMAENISEITNEVVVETEDLSSFMSEFNGVRDPIVAMTWIIDMENVFNAVDCANEDKVMYAVSMLRSQALSWRDMVKDKYGPEFITKMTWSQFKEVFKEEFCPINIAIELEDEFMTLRQGNHTVQEFNARFMELAWFVERHLPPPETRNIYRFIRGLKANIRDLVSSRNPTTFHEAVEAAKEIEMEKKKKFDDLKRKWDGLESVACNKSGKSHEGDCRYGSKGCYWCGGLGHSPLECTSLARI